MANGNPFEGQNNGLVPDYQKFADALDLDEVAFLVMALKGSTNQKYFPLRAALNARLARSPIQVGLSRVVYERFYKRQEE